MPYPNFLVRLWLTFTLTLARAYPATAGFPKRGLCYNDAAYIQNWNEPSSQVNWAYNWGSAMDANFPDYLEYVPMLWSGNAGNWFANVNDAKARGSGHLLAFNEPDQAAQANMSPQEAVDAYRTYMMPYANSMSLGAPAVSNALTGLPWLQQFMALCTGCVIDFVPIHWYAGTDSYDYLYSYVADAAAIANGRPLWITEFNAVGDDPNTFLQTVQPWLDSQDNIYRYAWFFSDPDSTMGPIVDHEARPTYPLGATYGYENY